MAVAVVVAAALVAQPTLTARLVLRRVVGRRVRAAHRQPLALLVVDVVVAAAAAHPQRR